MSGKTPAYVEALVGRFDAELILLHVIGATYNSALEDLAETELDNLHKFFYTGQVATRSATDPHGLLVGGPVPLKNSGRFLGGDLFTDLGLDDVPDQTPRSFNERKFVRKAALKQHSDAVLSRYVGCRN